MMPENWAWWLLAWACVAWYSTITIYVAVQGAMDIKHMLARLSGRDDGDRDKDRGTS
jgi:hypothetical protein